MSKGFMTGLTLLLVAFWISSCKQEQAKTIATDIQKFGTEIESTTPISVDEAMVMIGTKDSIEHLVISGTVSEVCQAKGCWMNVVSKDQPDKGEIFVEFKDYAFFMPKDIAGSTVKMSGKLYRDVTSVEDLRHYAEDEGLKPEEIEKIVSPKEELKFMAAGVEIIK